jgi:hypothetical protein
VKPPSFAQVVLIARSVQETLRVPFAFEKRVMADIRFAKVPDVWKMWAPAMWKAAICGLCISGVTIALARYVEQDSTDLLASDLERTVLASVDSEEVW